MLKDTELLNILLESWKPKLTVNLLVAYLSLILKIKQKYSWLIEHEAFVAILSKEDKLLWDIITLLISTKKLKTLLIKNMIFLLKKTPQYKTELKISIKEWVEYTTIEKKLEKKLPESSIKEEKTEKTEVNISGNGRYYKRSFDKDVDKLLA